MLNILQNNSRQQIHFEEMEGIKIGTQIKSDFFVSEVM